MIPRLTFLFLLLVGLALGPVRAASGCGIKAGASNCHACCTDTAAACCAVSSAPVPPMAPAQTAPAAEEGGKLVAPIFSFLGFSPAPVVQRPVVHRRLAARMPVVPRLDLICVRLI